MKYTYLFTCLVLLIGLSGCGKKSIKPLTVKSSDSILIKDNITICVKKMMPQDSRDIFSGINLLAKGVQPLQVSISNASQNLVSVTQNNIGLPLIDIEECQELFIQPGISTGGVIGLIGIGLAAGAVSAVAGLYLFGAAFFGMIPVPFAFVGLGMFYGSPALPVLVPLIGVAVNSHNLSLNEQALHTAQAEGFVEQLTVEPHTTKDFLLLVKKEDYKNQFTLAVQQQYGSTSFDVMLPENIKKKLRV